MSKLFLVKHVMPLHDDVYNHSFIGWYTSEERAFAAIDRSNGLPGFRDHPDDFNVAYALLDEIDDTVRENDEVLTTGPLRVGPSETDVSDLRVVYELGWSHELDEDVTEIHLIGIFSTRDLATQAIEIVRDWPLFKPNPDGFHIYETPLDTDHSTTGFFDPAGIQERLPRP